MKTQVNIKQTLSSFWRFTRPDKKFFILGTTFAGLGTLIQDVIPPLIVSKAFDELQSAYITNDPIIYRDFRSYVLAYVSFLICAIFVWRIQVIFVWIYELRSMKRIMEFLFNHIQRQDSAFHANRFGGSLVSQVNKFVGSYERIMDEFTWSITTGVVAYVASILILAFTNTLYAFVLLLISILYMSMIFWRMKKQFPYDRQLASSESDRTAKLADMITNVATVRAFAGEEYENILFEKQTATTHSKYKELLKQHIVNDTMSHSGTALISILAFVVGIFAITNYQAPAGALFLAITYTMALSRRLWEFSRVLRNLNRGFGDASDMTEIIQIEPAIKDAVGAKTLHSVRGSIEFKNVDFYYPDQGGKLFSRLNLRIKPGEKVGLVGHSGSGKTTLSNLLLRFMDIQSGTITIDEQDISQSTQASVRQSIAYVPQESLMFHRTIADNIGYGNPSASQREIEAVAKMAHAHEFIKDLSDGYKTLVGERGVKLSGGQRQRVAIARAMLKNAPILLLDEATSALDSESETLIQDALWILMDGRTAIVIAHRLSTIQKMDRIIVMDKGKIVEQGTHKELIRKNGAYAKLWTHQSGGFIDE
ncbi:ABC transporter ATP-binding protein [Candidatus Saccharibacteria bacterium]|nr:ABC transporter ATP-binding protein [Candidatus Saccharibacteria bacterium]